MFFNGESPPPCPVCGKYNTIRIPRRPIDRLLSLFGKVRRYRCAQPECHWEGRLKLK